MLRADLTMRMIDPPASRRCQGAAGGHEVPEGATFRGAPTRFFLVTGKNIRGTFCEPCLVVAQALAKERRKRASRKQHSTTQAEDRRGPK